MFDEEAARSRSHGLRPEVLAAQADRLGPAPHHRPLHVADLRRRVQRRAARGEGRRRDPRHLRRHPVRRTSRVGRSAMCAAHGLTAVEPLFGLLDRTAVSRVDRLRRRRDHRHRARAGFWTRLARAAAAAGDARRTAAARRRSVRRTRRVSHRGDGQPAVQLARSTAACATGTSSASAAGRAICS